MWPELTAALARFPDAVLTACDTDGYPASGRCRPRPDPVAQVLRIDPIAGLDLGAGPASLLCHSHNQHLWALRSFIAHGALTHTDNDTDVAGWEFTPTRLSMGTGMAGPIGDLRGFLAARRRAARYLTGHGLARPAIPWARLRPPP
jgi:hypothetical protein